MKKIFSSAGALLILCASSVWGQVKLDVPFVTTDSAVVDSMLSVTRLTSNDVLYDLGCGDGRFVIEAYKKFGVKKAVGIDLDPLRIKDSNENAAKQGVTGKVDFREQDIFNADFSDATVITMYLLNSVNLRMRPILFNTLKPGTRIVSHDFTMGDWTPDRVIPVHGVDAPANHTVYYWVLPANMSGDWTFSIGNQPFVMNVFQKFQVVSGALEMKPGPINLLNMKLTGDSISFSARIPEGKTIAVYQFAGKISGDAIAGTATLDKTTTKWTATRNPRTTKTIQTNVDGQDLGLRDMFGTLNRPDGADTTNTFKRF